MACEGVEVFDHHLGLLGNIMGLQPHKASECPRSLLAFDIGIVLTSLDKPVVGCIGGIVAEHIQDKAFFDRLLHCVAMEWLTVAPKVFERGMLWSSGKGEEADIGLLRS